MPEPILNTIKPRRVIEMELNGINSNTYAAYTTPATQPASSNAEEVKADAKDEAAVYEKSTAKTDVTYTAAGKSGKTDQATINKLKSDAEARYSQLASLVEKLMTKQSDTYKYSTLSDLMKGVQSGEVSVDAATVAQAKKDVADDGYWGVEQTAERIVSFAKALTGGDSSKIEEMRQAIEKGFSQATKTWGDKLPEISSKTYDRINEMLDEWAKDAKN